MCSEFVILIHYHSVQALILLLHVPEQLLPESEDTCKTIHENFHNYETPFLVFSVAFN